MLLPCKPPSRAGLVRLAWAPARLVQPRSTYPLRRLYSTATGSPRAAEIRDVVHLPRRITPKYREPPMTTSGLLSLQWPTPPRNILLMPKLGSPQAIRSTIDFAKHLQSTYPDLNLIFEPRVAQMVHEGVNFPIYTCDPSLFPDKIDMITTLGGDGTILRAASHFSMYSSVPPILAFNFGTIGFLAEWKFEEYKRAWREAYMSGSGVPVRDLLTPHTRVASGEKSDEPDHDTASGWHSSPGKSMGPSRAAKILLRHRLKVGVYDPNGENINSQLSPTTRSQAHLPASSPEEDTNTTPGSRKTVPPAIHALNEILIHRGPNPHLAIIDIYLNNRFLTEAVADGILLSSPTGSTAYSLSAGGSIVHPLVKSLLITPICPRSLSFRPLVLPLSTKVTLRVSNKNRDGELEVSIDGKRSTSVPVGTEIRVEGENVGETSDGSWRGGVPCVICGPGKGDTTDFDDDGWVGGLNGLLMFNYPIGRG
ncbi:NADH kinase POS5 [Sodiomyces alkalinus F11]|uniref:NADH kinase POS5 n=1 Tax=Sodiomyces alkalinus (strain CBS 110278 / VKM F-3762 / F11) TaxID=1314773 RepID=A0A3N2QAA9_SODAK|nr:NADH kinase POS5 [Sodiomyces alkalinus F11]ROT43666.1 NADH kinase POS5 [Sodiomyces alkalinus F11]